MPLQVIQYPHPTLRFVSKPVKKIDQQLRDWIAEMFELMYRHKGIGLAANQVDLPYRLFVLNLTGDPAEKSEERVVINPVLDKLKGQNEAEEGCLSLPGLYADVRRPATVNLTGFDTAGKPIKLSLDGLFSRAVQHEFDHLDGRLFIDRLSDTNKLKVQPVLQEFQIQYDQLRREQAIGDDATIQARLRELVAARC